MRNICKGVVIFVLVSLLVSFIGCSGKKVSTENSKTQTEKEIKVGFSLITLSDAIITDMVSRIKTLAAEKNIIFSFNDCEGDPSAQISAVENFIYSGCDVIFIQALDAVAMAPKAKEAMDKGIKVVAFGIGLDYYDCWYKNDNYLVGQTTGKMAGEWIIRNCGGSAKVALIEYPTVAVLIDRVKGIEDGIKSIAPDTKIVARGSAIDTEGGMKLGENFLQQDPEIQVIVSFSDGPGMGAYEAVKVAGRDNEKFAIFGSDTSPVAIANIAAGTCYRGTVDCDTKINHRVVVEIAENLVRGTQNEKIVVMDAIPVTIDNIKSYQ